MRPPFPFAGSLIQQSGDLDLVYSRARQEPDEGKRVEILKELRMRRFSPSEIASLLGFPPTFCFPGETTTAQRYRVLGNSLNVAVVARLMRVMFGEEAVACREGEPVRDRTLV